MTKNELDTFQEAFDGFFPRCKWADDERRLFFGECVRFPLDQATAVVRAARLESKYQTPDMGGLIQRIKAAVYVRVEEKAKGAAPSFWEAHRRAWNAPGYTDFYTCIVYWNTVKEKGRASGGDAEVARLSRVFWRETKNDFINLGNTPQEAHDNATHLWGFDRGQVGERDRTATRKRLPTIAAPLPKEQTREEVAVRKMRVRHDALEFVTTGKPATMADEWAEVER